MTLPALPPDFVSGDTPTHDELNDMLDALREAYALLAGTTTATRHEARYEATAVQSIPNAADTKFTYNLASVTTADVTASGTNNTDFLLNRVGLWLVVATNRYIAGTTGERYMCVSRGTTIGADRITHHSGGPPTTASSLCCCTTVRIAAATSVHVMGYQSNGAALNTQVGGSVSHVALTWLRP